MALRLVTAATIDPVTLTEAKTHCRVDGTDDDALLTSLITAATQHISDGKNGWLGRALITQTWELLLDTFPTNEIRVPLPPLQSVTFVKYVDEDGVTQTISASDYEVDLASEPGWIIPVIDVDWPTPMQTINAVTVRFVCGYGNATTDVPEAIRAGMLLLIGHWYAQREAVVVGQQAAVVLPMAVEALLMPYRRVVCF